MTRKSDVTKSVFKTSLGLYVTALISSVTLWVFDGPAILAVGVCLLVISACVTMIYATNLREAELNSEEETNDD